jgi:hypothetical protein
MGAPQQRAGLAAPPLGRSLQQDAQQGAFADLPQAQLASGEWPLQEVPQEAQQALRL